MERFEVRSSHILSIGYDAFSRTLEMEFRDGNIYQYYQVPQDVFIRFMDAPSKGKFFDRYIRSRYPYRKVEGY